MGFRPQRLAKLIQQEIADLLLTEFGDYTLAMVTVTGAEVSRDLAVARVYVSIFAPSNELRQIAFQRLQELTPKIRAALASRIRHQVRFIPELRFELDETLDQVSRIEDLLAQARAQRKEEDAKDADE